MVDLTRRKTILGLGLLATGSGATFTSANFQSSTTPDSDLRVLVEANLSFGANPDLPDEDYYTDNPNLFDDTGSGDASGQPDDGEGGAFEDGAVSAPLGFVDGANDDMTLKTLVNVGETHTFEEMFQLENNTNETLQVGIAYDRTATGRGNGANGQYGVDIDIGGEDDELDESEAQRIYQFQLADGTLLSPESGATGETGNSGGPIDIGADDAPANLTTLGPGESVNLDLVVDTATDEDDIEAAADIDLGSSAFGFQSDTVQIMEEITVVSQ